MGDDPPNHIRVTRSVNRSPVVVFGTLVDRHRHGGNDDESRGLRSKTGPSPQRRETPSTRWQHALSGA